MKTHTNTSSAASVRLLARLRIALVVLCALLLNSVPGSVSAVSSWNPTLLVNTESFEQIDRGDGTSTVDLQFGATTSTLKLLTNSTFQFNKSLSVLGGISGSYLTIDRQANISGALLVKSSITSRSTVSGANLTFMGVTSSYILGSVGIGNASPKAKFDVVGTISGSRLITSANANISGSLLVRRDANFGDGTLFVDSTNKYVGIGTASPVADFHLQNPLGATTTNARMELNAATSRPILSFYTSGGDPSAKTAIVAGRVTADIAGYGYTGTAYKQNAAIRFTSVAIPTASYSPGTITFLTTQTGSVTPTEAMRIDSAGYVGIGTDTPGSTLSVAGSMIIGSAITTQSADGTATMEVIGNLSGSRLTVSRNANISGALLTKGNLTSLSTISGATLKASQNFSFFSGTPWEGTFDHALTAARTWTLPDATTTIVGIDTTDTLTNKTINVDKNTISSLTGALVWYVDGDLTTGTEKSVTFTMPYAATVADIELHVKTAPTGQAIIVDVNENDVSVFGTKPQINAAATTEADTQTITDTTLAKGAEITLDIDQVGSGTAGNGLTVQLMLRFDM